VNMNRPNYSTKQEDQMNICHIFGVVQSNKRSIDLLLSDHHAITNMKDFNVFVVPIAPHGNSDRWTVG
jgi:hypothetical protein